MASEKSSKCDVCLASDREVQLSPHLPALLQKCLNIKVDIERLSSCSPCYQLLTLWDDFSQQAKLNLTLVNPQDPNTDEEKTKEAKDAIGLMSIKETSHLKPETAEVATQTTEESDVDQKTSGCTHMLNPTITAEPKLAFSESQTLNTKIALQLANIPLLVIDKSPSKTIVNKSGPGNVISAQKQPVGINFTDNLFRNIPVGTEELAIDCIYSLASPATKELPDKSLKDEDMIVTSSSNLELPLPSRNNDTTECDISAKNTISKISKVEDMSFLTVRSTLLKELECSKQPETKQEVNNLKKKSEKNLDLGRAKILNMSSQNDVAKNKKTSNKNSLKKYAINGTIKLNFSPQGLPCPTCSASFPTQLALFEHVMNACLIKSYGDAKFVCTFCSRHLNSKTGLHYHVQQHFTELSTYPCNICGKVLSSSRSLSNHSNIFHQSPEKPECVHSCPLCKQEFSSGKLFIDHTAVCPQNIQPFVLLENIDHLIKFAKTVETSTKSSPGLVSHKSKIRCDVCGVFVKYHNLALHMMRMHSGASSDQSGNFNCIICNRKFTSRGGMLLHKKHHSVSEIKSKEVSHLGSTSINKPTVHTSIKKCPVCCKEFSNFKTFEKHRLRFHDITPNINPNASFKCKICGRRFERQSSMLRHQALHISSKNPALQSKLDKLKLRTSVSSDLKVDLNVSITVPESNHSCELCGRFFNSLAGIIRHLAYHPGEKAQTLKLQLMETKFKSELQNTSMIKHDENISINDNDSLPQETQNIESTLHEGNFLKCTICDITVKHAIQLKNHVLWTHKQDNKAKIKCKICDLRFISQEICDNHMLEHPCTAAQQKDIINFSNGNEMPSPIKQNSCNKSFTRNLSLRHHLKRVHPDTATFQQKHVTTLSNGNKKPFPVKPISCTICNKSFTRTWSLRHHLKHVHPDVKLRNLLPNISKSDKTFTCNYCDKAFAKQSSLSQHLRCHSQHKASQNLVTSQKEFCEKTVTPQKQHIQKNKSILEPKHGVQCHFCKKIVPSRFITSHVIKFHTIKKSIASKSQFPCDYCHLIFTSESDLDCHFKVDHLMCLDSSKTAASDATDEKDTKNLVDNKKTHECKYCFRTFMFSATLNVHIMNFHANEVDVRHLKLVFGKYKCQHCGKYMSNLNYLRNHIKTLHSKSNSSKINGNLFKCKLCSRLLPTKNGLKRHMMHHQRWPLNM